MLRGDALCRQRGGGAVCTVSAPPLGHTGPGPAQRLELRPSAPAGTRTACEDTPSRPHATTTPYDPPPIPTRRDDSRYDATGRPEPPIAPLFHSKSLNCNFWYLLDLLSTKYRPLFHCACAFTNKILSRIQSEIMSRVLRPLALEPEISLASLPILLHSLADPRTLNVRNAVTSHRFVIGTVIINNNWQWQSVREQLCEIIELSWICIRELVFRVCV
jgi:hypothetical protein